MQAHMQGGHWKLLMLLLPMFVLSSPMTVCGDDGELGFPEAVCGADVMAGDACSITAVTREGRNGLTMESRVGGGGSGKTSCRDNCLSSFFSAEQDKHKQDTVITKMDDIIEGVTLISGFSVLTALKEIDMGFSLQVFLGCHEDAKKQECSFFSFRSFFHSFVDHSSPGSSFRSEKVVELYFLLSMKRQSGHHSNSTN